MTDSNLLQRSAAILSCAWAASLVACAVDPAPVKALPVALDPGAPVRTLTTLSATGVQVYECRTGPGPAEPAWVLVAPEATLFDRLGRTVGTHGAGPFWQAHDGSRIEGSVAARADAPRAGDIPWLLLRTRSSGNAGLFSGVTHVQRFHTQGGIAPADDCVAAIGGQQRRVPYRAEYRLFVAA